MQDPESPHPPGTLSRRGALECMTWAGTGLLWSLGGGLPSAVGLDKALAAEAAAAPFTFLQISDSHVGFNKPANPDALGDAARGGGADPARCRRSPPSSSTPATSAISRRTRSSTMPTRSSARPACPCSSCPASTTCSTTGRASAYLDRYGKGTRGRRLVQLRSRGRPLHRPRQRREPEGRRPRQSRRPTSSPGWSRTSRGSPRARPIVVFAHIPLWTVYPEWGWGTQDGAQALACSGASAR